MENEFTWQVLATTGGAATVVSLFTQYTKELGLLKKIPTKIQVYALSLIITATAAIFIGTNDIASYALLPVNALFISFTAMGEYHALLYKLDNNQEKDK